VQETRDVVLPPQNASVGFAQKLLIIANQQQLGDVNYPDVGVMGGSTLQGGPARGQAQTNPARKLLLCEFHKRFRLLDPK
jgi:hypothetical protein